MSSLIIVNKARRLAKVFPLLVAFGGTALGQQIPTIAKANPTTEQESLNNIAQLKVQAEVSRVYQDYVNAFHRQDLEIRQQNINLLIWQRFAANVILCLVILIAMSGICISVYQLYVSTRMAMKEDNSRKSRSSSTTRMDEHTKLEISSSRIRVETSFVGIIVLIISSGLLLVFVHEVLRTEVVSVWSRQTSPGNVSP